MADTRSELYPYFQWLFTGGDHAHGVWDPETGNAKTVKEPATEKEYLDHLEGRMGLGLCPVNREGTVRFAAIDIDVDNIDHLDLRQKLVKRNMPLNVCRSKSGGAHLYLFVEEPVRATSAITVLKKWAGILGFPRAEIFPKQAKITRTNIGNWLNAPYFDEARTVRYGFTEAGPATLHEFLSSVIFWDGKDRADDTIEPQLIQIGQMPPCLGALTREGLPACARNMGLFNFGVFFRKASPNGWEDLLVRHNQEHCDPPLPNREVQAVVKSVNQRTYQYTCNQEPICSRCDRRTCLTLPYGVGNEPWKDQTAYAELLVGNPRKILTDPPRWIVEVNGHDVDLATDQLLNYVQFQRRVFEVLSVLVVPQKKEYWDRTLIDLLSKVKEIEAPKDASEAGMILELIHSFLGLHERGRASFNGNVAENREDLLRGIPVRYKSEDEIDNIAFRIIDLQKYLHAQRSERMPNQILYQLLYKEGCRSASLRVSGKVISVWLYPFSRLNYQTEDFTPPSLIDPAREI